MAEKRVHLNVDEARRLGERALAGIGYDAEEARIVTDHVIDAALCGYEYSGLAKLLNIPEHRRWELPRTPDTAAARDPGVGAVRRRQQCRDAGDVPRRQGDDRQGAGARDGGRRRHQ